MASSASEGVRALPALTGVWSGRVAPLALDELTAAADRIFLALPEAASAALVPDLLARGARVLDLSGAFRLRDAAARARWYPQTSEPECPVAYGLTERRRDALAAARIIACPGCYPTSALLALEPLSAAGLLAGDVVIDAKSGISGAGKTPSERTHFSERHGSVAAYGVFSHRHAAEIEQELGRPVTFVPHLVPLDRGILTTIYTRVPAGTAAETLAAVFEQAYGAAPFVRLRGEALPEIRHVGAYQLLRRRLEAGCGQRPARAGLVPGQPGEGGRGPGGPEFQRGPRFRRTGGADLMACLHVVKLGGELLEDPRRLRRLARTVRSAAPQGGVLIVHGGGRAVDAEMARLGLPRRAVDGLRITDAATLDVVLGVLAGQVNTRLVAALGAAGGSAVGLTGADAGIARVAAARRYRATDGTRVDLGFVGLPRRGAGTPRLLIDLLEAGHVPVVASIGVDGRGRLYNVNADTLAADLAVRLGAGRLTVAGTTRGVLDGEGRTIPAVDDRRLAALVRAGHASAGMIAKLLACRAARKGGVAQVRIVDGTRPGMLQEAGAADTTMVTAGGARRTTSTQRKVSGR